MLFIFRAKKFVTGVLILLLFNSCFLFETDEEKAIELVQQAKATEIGNISWLDYANERANEKSNKKHFWKAEKTDDDDVYLVAFQDEKGWGTRWEVTLREKIVKVVTGNDYLCMKYNLTRFDPELLFKVTNIRVDTLKVEGEKINQGFWESLFSNPKYKNVVVYRFEADVTNNTDKYITDAEIKGKLKLIFEEKTIIGASGSTSFNSSISKSKPWGPKETKGISLRTKDIDKVFLNYDPAYVVFEINLEAEDPIGFSYNKNVWEVDLTDKWKFFTKRLKKASKKDV